MIDTAPTVEPGPASAARHPLHADAPPMHDRVPAQALIEQVLLRQAGARPRNRLQRLLGADPLGAEARSWYVGATGERAVAARLAGLPEGWTVLHSLPVGRSGADIDHLVVGPGGVFTINTKHHVDASVWVAGRTVLVAGHRQPYAAKAEAEARRVDRIVAEVLDHAPRARPLVAVVGAKRLTVKAGPTTVTVLRAEHLRRFLRAQPVRLQPAQVALLAAAFDRPMTWQPTTPAGPEVLLAFAGLAREVRAAARTRLAWAATGAAAALGGGAAMVVPAALRLLGA